MNREEAKEILRSLTDGKVIEAIKTLTSGEEDERQRRQNWTVLTTNIQKVMQARGIGCSVTSYEIYIHALDVGLSGSYKDFKDNTLTLNILDGGYVPITSHKNFATEAATRMLRCIPNVQYSGTDKVMIKGEPVSGI